MITYAGINLTNKRFQVGSTVDFSRRYKEHRQGKGDLEFQRSLRKNPENFYWIVGLEDHLEDRSEEQYYLDFYCGSVWCYNHNPQASAPPSQLGKGGPGHHLYGTKLSEERKQAIKERNLGELNPFYGKNHTEETKERLRELLSGENGPNFGKNLSEETRNKISKALTGRTGALCHFSKKCEVTFPCGGVKVYNSVTEAGEDTGMGKKNISRWARNECKSKKGYFIRYLEEQ